jgi:hypothetical protein
MRDCYTDLMQESDEEIKDRNKRVETLDETAFLAYLMAEYKRADLKDFALFHAPKNSEGSRGWDEVLCSVWINGKLEMDSVEYGLDETHRELRTMLPKLEAMLMDDCSMGFSIEDFRGVIFVAASPSVSTRGLKKRVGNHYTTLYMPPWSLDEQSWRVNFLKSSVTSWKKIIPTWEELHATCSKRASPRRKCRTR